MNILIRKLKCYTDWLNSMDHKERSSFTGMWVMERIHFVTEAIWDWDNRVIKVGNPVTGYQPQLN